MVEHLDSLVQHAGPLGLLVLGASAAIEYVFPPFPGDTVTLLGGVYAVRGAQSVPLVYSIILVGSMIGALIDYRIGVYIGQRLEHSPADAAWTRRLPREHLHAWEQRFRRRRALWLIANRFLPGIRGPIFLAAGISGVPLGPVVLYGGLSAALFNALLFGAGYAVGGNAERLEALARTYGLAVWALLAVVALALVVRWAARRSAGNTPAGKT